MVTAIKKGRLFDGLAFVLIFLVVVGGYWGGLDAPWYFDDFPNIVENLRLRNLSALAQSLFSPRGLANFSFALNYHWGGLEIWGYRWANVMIHILTSAVVFFLLKRVVPSFFLSLVGSLLFAAHPLQTQAVTYVVQRMTSMAGLFFFAAIYLYCRFRESPSRMRWLFYGGALLSGAAAVLTKQNAAVLPVVLILFDYFFLKNVNGDKRGKYLFAAVLPFCFVPFWAALHDLFFPVAAGRSLVLVGNVQRLSSQMNLTSLNYFFTELSVFWLYIRLLFLPVGQALDYGYPLVESFFNLRTILSAGGIVLLLACAAKLRQQAPLFSSGVFWFFITLSIESTFIPLDPVFEHRLYIPMFGFVLVLLELLSRSTWCRKTIFPVLFILVILTAQRNNLWADPIAFYEDNLRQVPKSERVVVSLSESYLEAGRFEDAIAVLQDAISFNASYWKIYLNLSRAYLERKEYALAKKTLKHGLALNPVSKELTLNLGALYDLTGVPTQALVTLKELVARFPRFPNGYLSLGVVYAGLKRWDEAILNYEKALSLMDENATAHNNLGIAYYNKGDLERAYRAFAKATQLEPTNGRALNNYASAALLLGRREIAAAALPRLRQLNPGMAATLAKEIEMADLP